MSNKDIVCLRTFTPILRILLHVASESTLETVAIISLVVIFNYNFITTRINKHKVVKLIIGREFVSEYSC